MVFEHSPYRGDFGDAVNHPVDFDFLPQEFLGEDGRKATGARKSRLRRKANARAARARLDARADLPDSSLDNYYVPRGYAVVLGESIGTFNSDGCPTVGDRVETLGTKAVIDWLNGRARGFDEAGNRVTAGLDDRRRWHDRRLLQRHPPEPGRHHRRRGARDDHPGLGDLQLVRLLPRQRPGRRPALGDPGSGGERLPRRGHRRARLLHRWQPDGRSLRPDDPRASPSTGPRDRRLEPVLGGARLSRRRASYPRERVRGARAQRLERQDQGIRRVVVSPRPLRGRAQAVAAQRRPRRTSGR